MAAQKGDNVAGALMFFAYIVSALVLTGLICRDLLQEYSGYATRKRLRAQSARKDSDTGRPRAEHDIHLQVSILAALSAISFAVLSYHMLSFLIESYQSWGPSDSLTDVSSAKIWKWSIGSTLFQDFAEVINNDPDRHWWTKLALTYTLGWNIYMVIEGFRHSIPHLWAYFLLDQILPVSFTQNLFLLALLFRRNKSDATARNLRQSAPYLQVLLTLGFVALLGAGPPSVGTVWLIPVLLASRALLVAPFLVLRPQILQTSNGAQYPAHSASFASRLGQHQNKWALTLVAASIASQLAWGLRGTQTSPTRILSALHDSPAVSTLGYDAVIGMFSLGVSTLMDSGIF